MLVVAALLAGCGGSSGDRLTHAEFVKRANKLCSDSIAKLKRLENPTGLPELVTYLEHARPIQSHFLAEARKLKPPLKDVADWRRALAFDETVLRYYDELAAAAKRNDRNNLRRVSATLRALPAKNPYELRLGLEGC
jgi:hypothetical protein